MKRIKQSLYALGAIIFTILLYCNSLFCQDNYFGLYPKNFVFINATDHYQQNNSVIFQEHISFVDSTTFTEIPANIPGIFNGTAIWYDYDNDQDLDIILSGTCDTMRPILKIFLNDNGTFNEIYTNFPNIGHGSSFDWGDFDNDGDLDLAIQGATNFPMTDCYSKIYRNDDNNFIDINAPLLGLAGGSVVWEDVDNDGKLDLLISGSPDHGYSFYTKIYKNVDFNFEEISVNLPGVWGSSIALNDYDNDGDKDLLIAGYGYYSTITKLFKNEQINDSIFFIDTYSPLIPVNSGSIAWGDFNNDGFDDIALSGISHGNPITKIYKNNHGLYFTEINANLKPLAVSSLSWGDYDNDGFLDLAISGSEDFEQGLNPTTKIYKNDGGNFIDLEAKLLNTWFGAIKWGDYNNDGKIDLLVTGSTVSRPDRWWTGPYYPITKIFKNNLQTVNTPPTTPTNLSLIISQGKAKLSWQSSSDDQTPQNVLTYNLRIGTTPGGHEILAPNSNLQTGYRRCPINGNQGFLNFWNLKKLPPGTYYWNVQAVDNGYLASVFANEQSFIVTSTGEILENIPKSFNLYQNYPNPFNSSTTIKFLLNVDGVISLKIYNIFGQEILKLIDNKKLNAGEYSIDFSGENISSGIYLYTLFFDNKQFSSRKMILLK